VQNGTVDIECGGTANNAIRQKEVAFSVATFVSQPRWLVRVDSGLKTAADLKGKVVVTTQGSNAVGFARQISQGKGLDLKIIEAKDHSESMLMLGTGRVSAFLEDDILLAGEKANAQNPTDFAFLPDGYDTIYYGLMFRRDDPHFKVLVDEVLAGLMRSTEFERIYKKWFESPIPPRGNNLQFPMSARLKERVKNPSDKVD
jgi:glutamate/aspartate transport system substrate-binding protein